jgi:hypothetical protein
VEHPIDPVIVVMITDDHGCSMRLIAPIAPVITVAP